MERDMKALTYSSNRYSELNEARRELWAARGMIGAANKNPERYGKAFWFGQMNRARANLRKVAYKVRAELADQQARAGK